MVAPRTDPPLDAPAELIAPSEAEWRAMSPDQQAALLDRVLAVLSDPALAMTEGRRHKKAKTRALDALGIHFGTTGRAIYLAEEMAVLYPGERIFTPDVLAVVGVVEPEDDPRMAWVVVDEQKGLDFVLEVLHHGDRNKDLVENVERYAHLGILEYFVYDRLKQHLHGFRLSSADARRYQRLVPQVGRLHSTVLELDLAIHEGMLRFYSGMAELPGSFELVARVNGMLSRLEEKTAQAEQDAAQARDDAARTQEQALVALRSSIFAIWEMRNLRFSEEARARVVACGELATLERWLRSSLTAPDAASAVETP